MMPSFADDILEAAKGEPILGVVVGEFNSWELGDADAKSANIQKNVVLTWDEARVALNYEYDDGFDGSDCHPIYAWTETRVLFVAEYHGSTWIASLPRHPIACEPQMNGEN